MADSLSRVESIRMLLEIDLNDLAEKQEADLQLKTIHEKRIQWLPAHTTIYCEITGEAIRPYIPESLRETVFNLFYKPAYPVQR